MMNTQLVKVYAVRFFNYTDYENNMVSDVPDDGLPFDGHSAESIQYMHVPNEGFFLIPEYELKKYAKFGGGYRTVEYVGCMYFPSEVNNME